MNGGCALCCIDDCDRRVMKLYELRLQGNGYVCEWYAVVNVYASIFKETLHQLLHHYMKPSSILSIVPKLHFTIRADSLASSIYIYSFYTYRAVLFDDT
jgi:hypothetical protein